MIDNSNNGKISRLGSLKYFDTNYLKTPLNNIVKKLKNVKIKKTNKILSNCFTF